MSAATVHERDSLNDGPQLLRCPARGNYRIQIRHVSCDQVHHSCRAAPAPRHTASPASPRLRPRQPARSSTPRPLPPSSEPERPTTVSTPHPGFRGGAETKPPGSRRPLPTAVTVQEVSSCAVPSRSRTSLLTTDRRLPKHRILTVAGYRVYVQHNKAASPLPPDHALHHVSHDHDSNVPQRLGGILVLCPERSEGGVLRLTDFGPGVVEDARLGNTVLLVAHRPSTFVYRCNRRRCSSSRSIVSAAPIITSRSSPA